jgi:glycosyltransferase involved in cell wall biosynthesis
VTTRGDIDVALVTEGTYPFHHGGVTVWCDQLVQGLPDRRFAVVAITGTGDEQPVMSLPGNLVDVVRIPLWGPERRRRRCRPEHAEEIGVAHEALLRSLGHDTADPEGDFLRALRRLHELSRVADVAAELRGDRAIERVHAGLRGSGTPTRAIGEAPSPTVGDALAVADLIEHFLRPLWIDPPRAGLTHCVSNGLPALIGFAAKWTYGTPLVVTEHGMYLRERYLAADTAGHSFPVRALVLRFFRVLTGAAYRVADLITPGSEYNRRWEVRAGADDAQIRLVHNGVNPDHFPHAGPEPDAPTLTWVGRIDPLKDLETLVRAFALVRDRIPGARLRMFGPTPAGNEAYKARCAALVRELGLDDAATFEGRVPEITDAYRSGHVVVLTSVSEGFPYTVIEAMASGRATVSTDVGGVAEAVGEAGLVVPPRDPEAIAAACARLLADDRLRGRLAAEGRSRVHERFTLARFLDIYGDIYDGVARQDAMRTPVRRTSHAAACDLRVGIVGTAA